MLLYEARPGNIKQIRNVLGNEKIRKFLFTLGCSEGEEITLISILGGHYIINLKGSRYAIDKKLAKSIELVS
ncbi:MAG: FeoA family protein [Desulfosporosinus sp.]|jgi:Fe2+ transport system protein FeoA